MPVLLVLCNTAVVDIVVGIDACFDMAATRSCDSHDLVAAA